MTRIKEEIKQMLTELRKKQEKNTKSYHKWKLNCKMLKEKTDLNENFKKGYWKNNKNNQLYSL